MTKPTITGDTTITDLGRVLNENIRIFNKIISAPLPTTSTSSTLNVNLKGKKRVLTVSGIQNGSGYIGATQELRIQSFIAEMEIWVNQGIQGKRTYTNSFASAYEVFCLDFVWDRNIESPGKIDFTIVLIEGGIIG